MKLCHVSCSRCGKQVSNTVESYLDDGLIVRAWVECAECVEKEPEQLNTGQQDFGAGVYAGRKEAVEWLLTWVEFDDAVDENAFVTLTGHKLYTAIQSKLKEWGIG